MRLHITVSSVQLIIATSKFKFLSPEVMSEQVFMHLVKQFLTCLVFILIVSLLNYRQLVEKLCSQYKFTSSDYA